jgi:hypothetical protein
MVGQEISIETLPDDALLSIFDQYVNDEAQDVREREKA